MWLNCISDCGTIENPTNGIVTLSNGTSFEASAIYACNEGFELVGTSRRQCLSSGYWSGAEPLCTSHGISLAILKIIIA